MSQIEKYGRIWPEGATALTIELLAFREGLTLETGGLGKEQHFWNVVEMLWPYHPKKNPQGFQRNPWADEQIVELCKWNYLGISGPKSSAKTEVVGLWGLVNWYSAPFDTLVLVTTTSVREARKRMWGRVRERHMQAKVMPGKLVDSMGKLVLEEGSSDRSSITLVPSAKDKEKEASEKLLGLKNKRVFLLIDEATDVSPAIFEATANLSANPFFQCVACGNFNSAYDPFGQFVTPKDGWQSITVDEGGWETKDGFCLHLDGEKTPNLDNDDKWPFLLTGKKLDEDRKRLGENSLSYWRFIRSFPAPAGSEENIYSEADLRKFEAHKPAMWVGGKRPIPVAGFDPGFTSGGDRSVLFLGKYGETEAGMTVHFDKYVELQENSSLKDSPRNYQIAQLLKEQCEKYGVLPRYLAIDATGAGDPLCDIIATIWSPSILRVKFSERPSNMPVSRSSRIKADESYGNRVSELWYVGREFLRAGQVRGVTIDLARELVARQYRTAERGKIYVESKKDMKARFGRSPDIADAAFLMLDVCRQRASAVAGTTVAGGGKYRDFLSFAKNASSLYS